MLVIMSRTKYQHIILDFVRWDIVCWGVSLPHYIHLLASLSLPQFRERMTHQKGVNGWILTTIIILILIKVLLLTSLIKLMRSANRRKGWRFEGSESGIKLQRIRNGKLFH